jgi:hypothetical protein
MAKQPSPGATRRAKAFLHRYVYMVAEDRPHALAALARAFDRIHREGWEQGRGTGRLQNAQDMGYALPQDELAVRAEVCAIDRCIRCSTRVWTDSPLCIACEASNVP